MDRVRIFAPALLAGVALLGQQGARVGSILVPDVGFRWVVAVIILAVLLAPKRHDRHVGARDAALAAAFGVSFVALTAWRATALEPNTSLTVVVNDDRVVTADSLQLDARRDLRRVSGRRRNVTLRTVDAAVDVPRDGEYRFTVDCDDGCELSVGETSFRDDETVTLEHGQVAFALAYRQLGGPARLRFHWDTPAFIELLPIDYFLHSPEHSRRSQRRSANSSLILLLAWWGALSTWAARLAPFRAQVFARRWIPATAAVAIVLYGSLLRFDALLVHSGRDGHAQLSRWVPSYGVFNPAAAPDDPYRADVRSYLERAETFSLRSFYAPSFREPFYIALTVPFLKLAGGEIGILIQSFFFSCATLVLFFFVARWLHGAWWASGLLIPVALHEWLILEAPTGYRMSAYGFFLLATVAVMFSSKSNRLGAALSGGMSALLCLIRLSALSVVLPLIAVRLWSMSKDERFRCGAVTVVALLAIVSPFLISNTLAHGDPFYAVSFHTEFWMRAEGLDASGGPVSFGRYFTDFDRAGAVIKGTIAGLTALPVKTFWRGLRLFPVLDATVLVLGAIGLLSSIVSKRRFLAAAYFCHLIPFAYIQNFPSGEMPRFVMPAYFFLVLAVPITVQTVQALGRRYPLTKE